MADLLLTRARLASLRKAIRRKAAALRVDAELLWERPNVRTAELLAWASGLDHAASLITQWAAAERRKEKRRRG